MKRLADLPLIVKMGFAPLLALIALLVVTGIGYFAQKQQSAALQRVAEQDMVSSLRFAALEQKIAADHGQMFVLIVMTVMALEAAVGFAVGTARFRARGSVEMEEATELKG